MPAPFLQSSKKWSKWTTGCHHVISCFPLTPTNLLGVDEFKKDSCREFKMWRDRFQRRGNNYFNAPFAQNKIWWACIQCLPFDRQGNTKHIQIVFTHAIRSSRHSYGLPQWMRRLCWGEDAPSKLLMTTPKRKKQVQKAILRRQTYNNKKVIVVGRKTSFLGHFSGIKIAEDKS